MRKDLVPDTLVARFEERTTPWVDTGDGWLEVILWLDQALTSLDPGFTLRRIASVEGELLIEGKSSPNLSPRRASDVARAIEDTVRMAAVTCEVCGEPGEIADCTEKGWYPLVLCDAHLSHSGRTFTRRTSR